MSTDSISIKLSRGQVSLIDQCDADLAQLKWYAAYFPKYAHGGNYIARRMYRIGGKQVVRQLHRMILERVLGRELDPKEICDHVNGNPLDNRRCNLRLATFAQSSRNVAISKHNSTGYKGVYWNKKQQKFCAQIQVNGKRIHLGSFDDPVEGHKAYIAAAKKYHGEFARFE